MGLGDKIKHAAEKAGGKGKETAGEATDNDRLKAEGKADQVKADMKKAGDKVRDAFKKH
ncbi:CsbD family protein [Arthrobacter dokdonensis]|uniref:CsbD family protein n=1 Tax=Arthrobacter dokdonellae TaxID=2211210 RepID=UPI000DE5B552|nr:CsbD family protein [Arthrobacter dokdonellae]